MPVSGPKILPPPCGATKGGRLLLAVTANVLAAPLVDPAETAETGSTVTVTVSARRTGIEIAIATTVTPDETLIETGDEAAPPTVRGEGAHRLIDGGMIGLEPLLHPSRTARKRMMIEPRPLLMSTRSL